MNQVTIFPLTADQEPVVGSVEMALDALVSATPKPGEKIYTFVQRCCSIVTGQKQRDQLFRAVMDSLNELGLKAVDPASFAQLALNATDEENAQAVAAQEGGAVGTITKLIAAGGSTPAADLTSEQRTALLRRAGVEFEVYTEGDFMDSPVLFGVRTRFPVFIYDRPGGGYYVAEKKPAQPPRLD